MAFVTLVRERLSVLRSEAGQGLFEYALIIALVAILLVIGLMVIQGQLSTMYSNVSKSL